MSAILEALLQILAAGVLALGGYAIQRLAAWLRLREDSEVRAYLNQALDRAVELALAEARGRLPTYSRIAHPEINVAVERAAEYVAARVPDALRRFGVERPALRDMVSARLATRMPMTPAG